MSDHSGFKISWPIIVGAGVVLIGGALLVNYLSTKQDTSSTKYLEDVDALGPPKKDANGFLKFDYYREIFNIVTKYGKQKFNDEKKDMLRERRKALREGDEARYREVVKEMMQKEE